MDTRQKLAALAAKIDTGTKRVDADLRRLGFDEAFARIADPRTDYTPNNGPDLNLFSGANSFFADPQFRPNTSLTPVAPPPAPPPAAPAPPAARALLPSLPMGLVSDPRASLPIGALPAAPAPVIPIPRARPAPTSYTIQKGDNPSRIAESLGLTLEQLEAKNPGLMKRARRLQIGEKLEI